MRPSIYDDDEASWLQALKPVQRHTNTIKAAETKSWKVTGLESCLSSDTKTLCSDCIKSCVVTAKQLETSAKNQLDGAGQGAKCALPNTVLLLDVVNWRVSNPASKLEKRLSFLHLCWDVVAVGLSHCYATAFFLGYFSPMVWTSQARQWDTRRQGPMERNKRAPVSV